MNESEFHIRENVLLAPYTSMGIGGPARFFLRAGHEDQILPAMDFARLRGCPVFILGGGSNLVVSDSGFPGLVLRIELRGIQPLDAGGETISVASGEEWDAFARYCADRDLAGMECLSGIPGTVGGAPIQNVGAYGADAGESILSIRAIDCNTHGIVELNNAACQFAYRSSIFNTTHTGRYVILKVVFILRPGGRPRIQHPDLLRRFPSSAPVSSVNEVREAVLRTRESKSMILRENDPDSRSAGSFFKNPILNPSDAAKIEISLRAAGLMPESESMPCFPVPEGGVKLSAAWLIERAGFKKGYRRGNAGLSSKHALAIVNRGGATAQEILDLMHEIQVRVYEWLQIELQPEPVFVGFN